MEAGVERVRDISLSGGETRLVHLPAKSLVVGLRGSTVFAEEWVPLGDAGFRIRVPVNPGASHILAYGGRVLFCSEKPSQLRLVFPLSMARRCAVWTASAAGAAWRGLIALSRRRARA
jgi:hypothetical protein